MSKLGQKHLCIYVCKPLTQFSWNKSQILLDQDKAVSNMMMMIFIIIMSTSPANRFQPCCSLLYPACVIALYILEA